MQQLKTTQLARPGAAKPHDASVFELIVSSDPALLTILRLSLLVSLLANAGAALLGLPLGALIARASELLALVGVSERN